MMRLNRTIYIYDKPLGENSVIKIMKSCHSNKDFYYAIFFNTLKSLPKLISKVKVGVYRMQQAKHVLLKSLIRFRWVAMLNHDLIQRCEILVLILSSFILSADQKPGLENEEPDKGIVNCTGSASNSENAEGSTLNADEKDDDESDDPKTRATPSPDIEQTGKNSSHFQLRCLILYDKDTSIHMLLYSYNFFFIANFNRKSILISGWLCF